VPALHNKKGLAKGPLDWRKASEKRGHSCYINHGFPLRGRADAWRTAIGNAGSKRDLK
jgi:hypothetical protein